MWRQQNRLFHIARKLTTAQLQQEDKADLDIRDLSLFEVGKRGSDRFLGFYSEPGLKLALTKYGFFKALERLGFWRVHIALDTQDPFVHRLRLDCEADGEPVLGELIVRKNDLSLPVPKGHELAGLTFEMLHIEWLYLQDPERSFDSAKPQLPGQDHPGLGLAKMVLELLLIMARRLNLAGLLNRPAHFHNAVMGDSVFAFCDPGTQGRYDALKRDLGGVSLQAASWAVEWHCVYDVMRQAPLEWHSHHFTAPLDARLKRYFRSEDYLSQRWQSAGQFQFHLDEAKLRHKASKTGVFIPRIRL